MQAYDIREVDMNSRKQHNVYLRDEADYSIAIAHARLGVSCDLTVS